MDAKTFRVADDSNYSENARVLDETVAVNQFQAYSKGNVTYLSRADGFANYAEATAAPSDDMYVMDDETREAITEKSVWNAIKSTISTVLNAIQTTITMKRVIT